MIKNPHCCFCIKSHFSFILNYKGAEKEVCVRMCVCVFVGRGAGGG